MQLYYQIPFNGLFKFLWSYYQSQQQQTVSNSKVPLENTPNSSGENEFRKRYVSMKIISFLDCLTRSSLRTLLLYNKLKYKNFCKLVGKTLREIIKFLSFMLIATRNDIRDAYESFLKRIISSIVYSSRLRPIRWTLLSQLNIGKLDLTTKWLLLAIMCGIDVYHPGFQDVFKVSLSSTTTFTMRQTKAFKKRPNFKAALANMYCNHAETIWKLFWMRDQAQVTIWLPLRIQIWTPNGSRLCERFISWSISKTARLH